MKKLILFLVVFYIAAAQLFASNPEKKLNSQVEQLFQEGRVFREQGENEKSIHSFAGALRLVQTDSGGQRFETDILMNLGILNWNAGRVKDSLGFFVQAETSAKNNGLERKRQTCLAAVHLTHLYIKAKDLRDNEKKYQESNKAFEEAIAIAKDIESGEHEIKCLRQLSINLYEINDLRAFFRLNSEARDLAKKLNVNRELGLCFFNIGTYFLKVSVYSFALENFETSLEIAQKLNSSSDEADSLMAIGNTYCDLGQYDRALGYLNSTLNIHKKLQDKEGLARDLLNMGVIYRRRGFLSNNREDQNRALRCYREAFDLYQSQKANSDQILILNNIGSVYFDLADYPQAMKYFREGLALAGKTGLIEKTSLILNNIGIIQATLGNYELSTDYYQRAIDLALKNHDGRILWEAYLEMANAFKKQGKFPQAIENYKNSIMVIEDIRSKISLEEQKASFLGSDKRIEPYQQLIDLFVEQSRVSPQRGFQQEAFNYLEKAKARAFLDSLEAADIDLFQRADMRLLNREKEISSDLSKLYAGLALPELPVTKKEETLEKIRSLETDYESLKREIRRENPAYANLRYPQIITLEETQHKLLDSRTAIWAYSIGKDRSFAFIITRQKMTIATLPPRRELQAKITEYLKIISDRDSRDDKVGPELSRILIPSDLDAGIKTLIIVPDDWLNFLPFETLPLAGPSLNWLIQKYQIGYIPSISSYQELLRRDNTRPRKTPLDLLAVGNPLPNAGPAVSPFQEPASALREPSGLKFSGREIRAIASLFKGAKVRTADGEQASEKGLKALPLNEFKILHFATHATIDDQNPARSYLLLSPSKETEEDGFLQTREIFSLRINADLVTLSACRTGLGQLIRGEGIEGLSRAFFYAGASAVLMSLWSIDDQASSQLMERFYTHLRSSESLAGALRQTKIELIQSGTLSHPFYWAGFILSGKSDTRVFPPSRIKEILLAACLLLAGAAVVLLGLRLRQKPGLLR